MGEPGQYPQSDATASAAVPEEFDAFNAWLREHLGRRLTIVALAQEPYREGLEALLAELGVYSEVRMVRATVSSGNDSRLQEVARLDPEVVLVWAPAARDAQGAGEKSAGLRWVRDIQSAFEDVGLLDRSFVALAGEGVTRAGARALGFEDGIAAQTPAAQVMRLLGREAVARDELRRRGSSPPCYL
jgi:hypothetical protein